MKMKVFLRIKNLLEVYNHWRNPKKSAVTKMNFEDCGKRAKQFSAPEDKGEDQSRVKRPSAI